MFHLAEQKLRLIKVPRLTSKEIWKCDMNERADVYFSPEQLFENIYRPFGEARTTESEIKAPGLVKAGSVIIQYSKKQPL
jgi:hypothetical protein